MKATIVVVVLGLAGFLGWQKLFSPTARIERAYQACLKDGTTAGEKMKADLAARAPPGRAGDRNAAMADAMTQGMAQVMQGMVQGLSGATCGAMKNACLSDFDGGLCQGALARYK